MADISEILKDHAILGIEYIDIIQTNFRDVNYV